MDERVGPGRNALHIAAEKGHLHLVRFFMVMYSEQMNVADTGGMTPFLCAA
jgi:hypothetical protein